MSITDLSVVPTKVRRPRVSPKAIARVRLHERLEAVLAHPVTLLTAPAGFGKTWLVADWAAFHPDVAQCWVTVDRYDNDAARLWLHTVSAVHGSGSSEAAAEALRLLETTGAGVATIVDALALGLAEQNEEMVIVLDDVHRLEGNEVLRSLDRFLRQLPTSTHVVLVGRHDPNLPLQKWRLTRDLLEIRTVDLRCTVQESREIVHNSLGLDLDQELIDDIHRTTMGWMAGIRLVATAGASRTKSIRLEQLPAIEQLDGAHEAIGDYLVEEVLDGLDESDRQFLLDTSIMDDMSGPLCATVAGRKDGIEVLERMARAEMFVSRIGDTDGWYRYHDLFRDALRTVLHRTAPAHEKELHLRAAGWLYNQGNTVHAVQHAIAAGDTELAARWLIESSRLLLGGKQFDTTRGLFEEVDNAATSLSPIATITWAFAELFGNTDGSAIDRVLDRARTGLAAMTEDEIEFYSDQWAHVPYVFRQSRDELLRGIDATIAHRSGDVALATATLARQGATPSESGWVEGAAGEMAIYVGRYHQGRDLLQAWNDYSFSPHNPIVSNQAYVLAILAWAKIGDGDLAEAEALTDRGVEIMRANGLADQPPAAMVTVPLAWVAWERGDLNTAHAVTAPVVDQLGVFGEVPAYVFAQVLLARIYHSQGNLARANEALDRAALLPSGRPVTGHFADYITFERCRLALLNNNVDGAELALPDWQKRISNGASTMTEHLVLARLSIATGNDPTRLLEATPDGVDVTSTHQIELHKLKSYAALHKDDTTAALDHLTDAMKIALHTGHRQTFLDDYPTFGTLIENAAAMAGHRLIHTNHPPQPQVDVGKVATLAEPLTEREFEVLQLLPTHLTYKEIGEQLYVSPNTVKSYLKNIYRKLEADSRNEAVTKARTLGLVE